MFQPSQADVRRFFCATHAKALAGSPMEAIETLASLWIAEHPEYHAELADVDAALARNYDEAPGRTNPFLHLSLHLAVAEQLQIDQPPGIRAAHATLATRLDSAHEAAHRIMDCLGETIWRAQRDGTPPDASAYLDCIRRKAG